MTKTCSKCKEVKPVAEFSKSQRSADGKQSQCKDCKKQYYQANKGARQSQQYKEKKKQYYQSNKEQIKQYYQANKNKILKRQRQYEEDNKKSITERQKQYYHANKDSILHQHKRYTKERRKVDSLFRVSLNIRSLITNSLTKGGYSKTSRTHEILGCSYEEYHQHIEAQFTDGMSWERMSEIHIDHRLPVSAASTKAEMLVLNHHRNLQPMWAEDNIAKSDSYCPDELAAYFAKYL